MKQTLRGIRAPFTGKSTKPENQPQHAISLSDPPSTASPCGDQRRRAKFAGSPRE